MPPPKPTALELGLSLEVSVRGVVDWAARVEHQYTSGVVDWWPASVPPPVGYHVTAPLADAVAPMVFDSHYAYSPSDNTLTYVHSALRNATLVSHALGAGGLCRAHSIAMPLFDANTNRICTRAPLGLWGAPHLPVSSHDALYNVLGTAYGPYDPAVLDAHFAPESCAPDASSVPWQDPTAPAGSVPGLRALFDVDTVRESSPLARAAAKPLARADA